MRHDQVFEKALALHNAGKHEDAIKLYKIVLMKDQRHFDANYLLGTAYAETGRFEEAKKYLLKSEKQMPFSPFIKVNLGNICKEQGEYETAGNYYARALELQNELPEAHNNLGATLFELGRLEEAEASCRRALELNGDFPEAHGNLGSILRELGRLAEAEASCRHALAIRPNYAPAYNNLGNIYTELCRLEEAELCFRNAVEIMPDYAEADSNLLFCMNYVARQHLPVHLEEACRYGLMAAGKVKSIFSAWQCDLRPERLRVGLVSGDLCNHVVGFFLESVIEQIDPSTIELFAYPTNVKEEELTARIKPYFSSWKPLAGQSDEAAARMIHADGVHLLLDLSGHTSNNRLSLFAWKPAPVQASWLGYFATTGVREMDYLLGDPYVTPVEEEGHFTETIWRLPESYLCFTPPDLPLEVAPLPSLSAGYITFGCFNNLAKMNDAVVNLWASVLQAVPGSRLFLKTRQLNDQDACHAVRERFAACGITSDRLLLEPGSPRGELLEAYNRVDIALDPFPYPGGTSSIEGLWMGVPVITLKGERFLSHVGETIAHNAGLADWIAESNVEYVDKAVMHAADLNTLASLRRGLRQQLLASPIFDATRFARNLEAALWGMWEQRQSSS